MRERTCRSLELSRMITFCHSTGTGRRLQRRGASIRGASSKQALHRQRGHHPRALHRQRGLQNHGNKFHPLGLDECVVRCAATAATGGFYSRCFF